MAIGREEIFSSIGRTVSRVRMVGVGGAGMCGLAEILLCMGYAVDGYDRVESDRTKRLSSMGANIDIHETGGLYGADARPDLVVYSAAIPKNSPELLRAAELGAATMTRAQLLGRIISTRETSIAVAGVHGKSTTTSMLGEILMRTQLSASILVGAEYPSFGGTALIGDGDIIAVEACEYSDSFLSLYPSIAVITNVDFDHADYFSDLDSVKRSFSRFATQAARFVVANAADKNSRDIYRSLDAKERAKWRFFYCEPPGSGAADRTADGGAADRAAQSAANHETQSAADGGEKDLPVVARASDIRVVDKAAGANRRFDKMTRFYLDIRTGSLGTDARGTGATIELAATGLYNVENALAAATAAAAAGVGIRDIADGLRGFRGVRKRFEYLGTVNGMDIADDYAHHPSEIRPALAAARARLADSADAGAKKPALWCVFQPHTYSRTRAFFDEFTTCFQDADRTLLADIYAAREPDPKDISSELLAAAIRENGGDATWFPGGFYDIAEYLLKHGKPGDLILTMGAGLASNVADILLDRANAKRTAAP